MSIASLLQMSIFFLAAILFGCGSASAQAADQYRITGTVVSSINGSPVPHCHLNATLITQGRLAHRSPMERPDEFDADKYGKFSIPLPSPGAWRLTASARGFVTQAYEEHQQFSSAVVLTPQAPKIDLLFRLPPEAAITGIVLDESGEPVRNAHLSLFTVPPTGPDARSSPMLTRASTQTDDRGMYEFANVLPGDYNITIETQPWYAASVQPRRADPLDVPQLDASLDVVYPLTWYPGVDDPTLAETITLKGGDTRQADFRLVPVPSIHLSVIPPFATATASGRSIPAFPVVERVMPRSGALSYVPVSINFKQQGQIDIGGLSAGLYQIRLQGQGADNRTSFIEVTPGSVRTLELGDSPAVATITIHIDGFAEAEGNPIQVRLTNVDTGQPFFVFNQGQTVSPGNLRQRRQSGTTNPDRTIQVPPGRYEAALFGRPDVYLSGITAQSAEITGRIVKVHPGNATLTIHVAAGRATLTGVAMLSGKPSVGSMVLLVPATLGEPTSIAMLQRDQSNTDGSFDFINVIPGQYILIAISNGWQINWSDPSTLRNYLMHGVPVDLSVSAKVKQNIEAQSP